MIAAARAVRVEVGGLDAVLLQIFSGGTVFLDGAGGRDVIGGHAVAEHGEHARPLNICDRRGTYCHIVEVRSLPNVSRVLFPTVGLTLGDRQAAPMLVSLENFAVTSGKHFG